MRANLYAYVNIHYIFTMIWWRLNEIFQMYFASNELNFDTINII